MSTHQSLVLLLLPLFSIDKFRAVLPQSSIGKLRAVLPQSSVDKLCVYRSCGLAIVPIFS